jgi:hypothetical protein
MDEDIVAEAKHLLCGISYFINEKTLNVIICNSRNRMHYEKEEYESMARNNIIYSTSDKTIFSKGGVIFWRCSGTSMYYTANIFILLGLGKNSKEYKSISSYIPHYVKVFII